MLLLISTHSEQPDTFHFLAAKPVVPLKQEFKPALKVLARKPQPTLVKRVDPLTGLEQLTVDDADDEVPERKVQLSAEEIRAKTQRDREEKQRRYDEARARILGTGSGGSGSSTPGNVTPPMVETTKGRGRGRGGASGISNNVQDIRRPDSRGTSKELYDPNYTPKPVTLQKRNAGEQSRSGRSTPREDDQVIRMPKGPDGKGRGFGAERQGDKTG